MKVIPFVHEGLGNSSYLVDLGDGSGLLVDPNRIVRPYLAAAQERGLRLRAVLETHLHADFVSGAREVAAASGATLFLPASAGSRLQHTGLAAGESLRLDGVEVEVIGSPGHTPEHLAYVLRTAAGPPHLFSGGSLIVGGAARTDLIAPDMTVALTRAQFRTLRDAFAALPDETVLLPTHGGGSFCSTGSGQQRQSTLGQERRTNPLLAFEDEQEFVDWFPTTFPATPAYYSRMRPLNQQGPRLRTEVAPPPSLAPADFAARAVADGIVIDARPRGEYAAAHIPGSLSIPFRDAFAVWLGWLVPERRPLYFVAAPEVRDAIVDECLLVGYEDFGGWLEGGIAAWKASGREIRRTDLLSPEAARAVLSAGAVAADVREADEFAAGHLEGALSIPLGDLPARLAELPRDRPAVVYCAAGDRASSAASLLEAAGFRQVFSLEGGAEAWREAGLPLTR
ncbi:MAG TPA: rhodanese-like domain-containing protein [Dehalococcoidia bacterium]|nr:rhodanese-like domain-containing protein [Dehalococcoidia bacterium]